jgi:peptide/nickel transport system substrate-binding protein
VPQSGLRSIVPDLAARWDWNEARTELVFRLRSGVRWHDGKPFSARDVKCTFDLLQGHGVNGDTLRVNPRKAWYGNLAEVVAKADDEVVFRLKRPQPAFIALLASGFTPIYPCHVSPAEMRRRPVGTGPFRFVEFKPNETIRVARNKDYWKADRPWLDGIEYKIMKNSSTGMLSFLAGTAGTTTRSAPT